jgi:hypothetical protein
MSRPNAEPPRISFQMVERKVGDLWVDPNVQRTLRKARVTKIADEFQASALGVLTTSYRSPKRIHIIDGQHRYRAAEAAAYTGVIQTMEYKGLTVPEEAALFRLLNTTEKVSRVDQFLVACVEQDPAAVHLAAILSEHGWEISSNSAEGRLTAVAALERVYAMDPNAAKATLHVLTKAYGRRPAAVQGSLLVGLGRVFAKYGTGADGVNLDDLSDRLSKVPGGPDGLLGNARGQKLTRTGDLSTQVARIVVDLYNQRRRTTALTRWE